MSTPTAESNVAAVGAQKDKEHPLLAGLANRPAVPVYTDFDEETLTAYQCLLRKQLELFEAGPDDVRGNAQGRNTPIRLGQVGIRCRHCAHLPKAARSRGSVYYSKVSRSFVWSHFPIDTVLTFSLCFQLKKVNRWLLPSCTEHE